MDETENSTSLRAKLSGKGWQGELGGERRGGKWAEGKGGKGRGVKGRYGDLEGRGGGQEREGKGG